MTSDYLRVREKENAKEWQLKEDAGLQKGNVHNYYNEDFDDSDSRDLDENLSNQQSLQVLDSKERKKASASPQPRILPKAPPGLPSRPPRQAIIQFGNKRDNAAKAAYRSGKPANTHFQMRKAFRAIAPTQAVLNVTLEGIANRNGSYIAPQRLSDSKVPIWGNPKQVSETKTALEKWERRATITSTVITKPRFAHAHSVTSPQYAVMEKRANTEARKHAFQKTPEAGEKFRFNGCFLWPSDEVLATDLFGPSCEAFDSIRMDCDAHVVFDDRVSAFRIHSDKGIASIQDAISRIENTMKEYTARDRKPISIILIDPPSSIDCREKVTTVTGPLLGSSRTASRLPKLTGLPVKNSTALELEEMESRTIREGNSLRLRQEVYECIYRLRYFRGPMRLRVQLGTFALVRFLWPEDAEEITFDKFIEDIQLPGTKGMMTRKYVVNLGLFCLC